MKKTNNNRMSFYKFAFLSSCIVFLFTVILSMGYSSYSVSLDIENEAIVRADVPLRFTYNSIKSLDDGAVEKSSSKYTVNTISNHIELPNCNSVASYKVKIQNKNNFPVVIKSLIKENWNNVNIDFEVIGYNLGKELINANSNIEFELRFKNKTCNLDNTILDSILKIELGEIYNVNYSATILPYSINNNPTIFAEGNDVSANFVNIDDSLIAVKINGVELTNGMSYKYSNGEISQFIVKNGTATLTNVNRNIIFTKKIDVNEHVNIVSTNSSSHFKAEPYNSKIKTATFVDYIDTSKAVMTWDLSSSKNGEVMAWVEENEDYYDLYIGSNKIITPTRTNAAALFYGLSSLETVRFNSLLDLSQATSIQSMFMKCTNLKSVDFETLDTSNINIFTSLFSGDKSLEYVNLSNFDTSKATKLNSLFNDCTNITELDLSMLNTENVDDMSYMFNGMTSLKSIDVSSFNTSNVANMAHMFRGDSSLESLNISNFDTGNVTNMYMMFYNVRSVKELDVSKFNTSKVTNMGSMFYSCKGLTTLDLSNFVTSSVTAMNAMFNGCDNLVNINLSSFNTEIVNNMSGMFSNCLALETLDISSFDTRSLTNTQSMFYLSRKLKTVYVSDKWDVSNVTSSNTMFSNTISIVGGNGTKYNKDYVTKDYARIDGKDGLPGYFTEK